MPLFTKMLKLRSFSEMRVGKYLLYALGEIVLVVVGILLALNINNKNEVNKRQQELSGILNTIKYDLEQDTIAIAQTVDFYTARRKITNEILTKPYTKEDYRTCIPCHSLITFFQPMDINDKGLIQLRNFNDDSKTKDTLLIDILQFYKYHGTLVNDLGVEVKESTLETISHWRDTQPWFADLATGKFTEPYLEYLESADYRNRVAYFSVMVNGTYIASLTNYKFNAGKLIARLKERDSIFQKSN